MEDNTDEMDQRPPSAKTLYALAKIYAAQGKEREAEALLLQITRTNPQFAPAFCSLAELQIRQQRIDDTIRTVETGLKGSPQDPVLLNNLGMCWLLRGQPEKALSLFTVAAARVPNNARYRANMAVCLGLLGRTDEAESLYLQILPAEQAQNNVARLSAAFQNQQTNNIQTR